MKNYHYSVVCSKTVRRSARYHTMFSKLEVNGDNAHPLYNFLKSEAPGIMGSEKIKWNFTKFMIDGSGKILQRFGSQTKPEEIEEHLLKLLSSTK